MNLYVAPETWGETSQGDVFDPNVFQGMENSCAIHSQYQILKDFGYTGSVNELKQEALDSGWYDPERGTNLCDVGKLLESHGVACDMYVNSNAFNLANELAQGKRVIVSVDSGELWGDSPFQEMMEDIMGSSGADHAVVVSGLDMSDPDNPMVVITDSGTGHAAMSYPLDQFTDAWRDGNCTMWVTHDAPPSELCPAMENFDYALGHVANIGSSSYDDWWSQAKELMVNAADFMKVAVPVAVGARTLYDIVFGDSNGVESTLGASFDSDTVFSEQNPPMEEVITMPTVCEDMSLDALDSTSFEMMDVHPILNDGTNLNELETLDL